MPDTERLYTAKEAAKMCGISDGRLRQIAPDLGVGRKFGRAWMFTAEDIARIRGRPDLRRSADTPEPKPEGA